MTTITLPRATVEQALHVATAAGYPLALIAALRAALEQQAEPVDADAAYQRWLGQTHAPALRRMDSQGAFAAGWQAALAQQAEPVAWVASKDGRVIYDDVSTNDVVLRVAGDFERDEQRAHYAQRIVGKLNAALAQQAEPVERGAAYGDALRWAIKACGALQRDDGVWFGDDAAARLARILSEGISPPQRMMVPLTDEEIEHIGMTHQSLRQVVRAVEKAVWEKNHGQA